jgi:hypothetical protein
MFLDLSMLQGKQPLFRVTYQAHSALCNNVMKMQNGQEAIPTNNKAPRYLPGGLCCFIFFKLFTS